MFEYDDFDLEEPDERLPDPEQISARETLEKFFEENREAVFYSRQLEVRYEKTYFHWITNRAIRDLVEMGKIHEEWRQLSTGSSIKLFWHRGYRYYKRSANSLIALVEKYSHHEFGQALGQHGELMALEGFARHQFLVRGRHVRKFGDRTWNKTEHDLDFIFERDAFVYGTEVKNSLSYIDRKEFEIKIELCKHLRILPVFVVRMMPKPWISELAKHGGFALILEYQLYPPLQREMAKQVSEELGLLIGTPRALEEGTMQRFLRWHNKKSGEFNKEIT